MFPPPPPRAAWAAQDCAPEDVWMAGVAPDSKKSTANRNHLKKLFERIAAFKCQNVTPKSSLEL